MQKSTIILNEKNVSYKISKVIFYGDNAGFGVLCPYHSAKKGYLLKYIKGTEIYSRYEDKQEIRVAESLQYSASDRVKLSVHTDGFVQFSGENPNRILSGRDPQTGEPKGMGIVTSPLSRPILSGPTFAITLWGMREFEIFEQKKKDEFIVEFEDEDYEYRQANKESFNAYVIEGFVFPPMFWSFSFYNDLEQLIIKFRHPGFQHETNKPLTFRVLPFTDNKLNYMLAILVSRANLEITEMHPSGFIFSSPTEIRGKSVMGMQAMYPAPGYDEEKAESLDFQKK